MKTNLLTVFALFIVAISTAQTFVQNNITYTVLTSNTVEVTSYGVTGGTVTIPSSVTNSSITYNVTEIGDLAFLNNQITGVDLPNTLTYIGENAFLSNQLTNVIIPNSVTELDYRAFGGNQLTSVTLSNNLTTIGERAFEGNQISSITIPDSVTLIEEAAFFVNQLTNVVLGSGVTTIEVQAFQSNQLASIIIPENVTSIGASAFATNPLTSVTSLNPAPPSILTIPNSISDTFGESRPNIDLFIPAGTTGSYVTDTGAQWTGFNTVTELLEVGDTYTSNFITYEVTSLSPNTAKTVDYDTTGGTSVAVPNTMVNGLYSYDVTAIGNNSFDNSGLTDISIPTSVTTIGQQAFLNNSLTSINIPNTVTEIGQAAFAANSLTSIVVPDSVISLGDSAFEGNALTSATLPDALTAIGNNVFTSNNLTSFTFSDNITSIGIGAFQGNNLNSLTFGANLATIDAGAFADNDLAIVNIPASVTTIGNVAFNNNPMTDVYSFALTPPIITTGAGDSFATDRSTIHLHIPAGTLGVYVTDAGALWTGFNPVTEDILGIFDVELERNVRIITTENTLQIMSDNNLQLQDYTMYSISGVEIIKGKESSIATSTFTSGIYILKLNFDKGTIVKKVVVN
ncbi:MAG: leucine-rich repeat domain-containing protein [Flavobacteriaceae bacterium]